MLNINKPISDINLINKVIQIKYDISHELDNIISSWLKIDINSEWNKMFIEKINNDIELYNFFNN